MAKKSQPKARKNVVVKDLTPKDSGAVQGGTIVLVNGGGNTPR